MPNDQEAAFKQRAAERVARARPKVQPLESIVLGPGWRIVDVTTCEDGGRRAVVVAPVGTP